MVASMVCFSSQQGESSKWLIIYDMLPRRGRLSMDVLEVPLVRQALSKAGIEPLMQVVIEALHSFESWNRALNASGDRGFTTNSERKPCTYEQGFAT
ncbi:hypothetical protein J1N35_004769 [Gossypium stocksii]|uniref:Uncharacterized protein n=1 Tax=Gossypium stocksii TaxID=47602 RepID=A0A9D4AI01_9ROSI|nr:hypothetical protein J1N35_004769 [Gossypium stocksii]